MAVGASPADVGRLVSRQLLQCVAGGIVIGLCVAAVGARTLSALVFGIGVFDLPTIAVATAVLAITAALSAAVPVRRATRVDPVITLRAD
jgi:ABC-type antimicrobial peptide transport system permease subunit